VLNEDVRKLDKVAARLVDPASGRVLEMRTNEVSIQVYTPATIREGLLSDQGKPFPRAPSIALEAEHLPDAINFPHFPTIVLKPGQTFRSTTIYGFTTEAKP
jgi:aldose 1-epimerase